VKKYSRKRDAILEKIRSTKTHPSADWVYAELRPEIPDLSLGTVYRNISLFKKEGLLSSVGVIDGVEHYDGNVRPHSHFICETCGKIIDVDAPQDLSLDERVGAEHGMKVLHHQTIFYGICKHCLQERAV
jgi:Fur family peroxide stress response transcriptional regulator